MNRSRIKLAVIKKVTECEDEELLQTVLDLMQNLQKEKPAENVKAALEQSKPWEQTDLRDLQDSIDDIFGMG